ncbi:hypothetical protein LQE88_01525 [Acidaminococcus sp. NSJ-142]|jgi:hypothetical protein|uniref:hypothetical protein n=1 Tax=Acidaminococcus TaxID=904 RepID=UPI000CF9A435|nr:MULTISPECIES: hypothetical protein [Acidaminococcus]MCD2434679.1 hypothetical protein [Acidaminococcus hominis]MCH4095313.1 hypothetical protein [Acidaminococcus provencensis]RHK03389.1 hypothetical protein DW089_01665 [Acidaminococcus sp. AM05-11]
MSVLKYWNKRIPEIEKYCAEHHLSVKKFRAARKCFGPDDYCVLADTPPNYDVNAPLPPALIVRSQGDALTFEQTEYTQKTLGNDDED